MRVFDMEVRHEVCVTSLAILPGKIATAEKQYAHFVPHSNFLAALPHRVFDVVDVIVVGGFNRHDQLWGGDDVSIDRHGEDDPIIDLLHPCGLNSLLPQETKT